MDRRAPTIRPETLAPLRSVQDVLEYKRAVPFTMFTGGVGRHAQGKLPIAKDYMGDPSSKTVRKKMEGKKCLSSGTEIICCAMDVWKNQRERISTCRRADRPWQVRL